MVDSLLIHIWQRPWTRIFGLAIVLGLWITMVVAGCTGIVSALCAAFAR
jgi:hypothetical protein